MIIDKIHVRVSSTSFIVDLPKTGPEKGVGIVQVYDDENDKQIPTEYVQFLDGGNSLYIELKENSISEYVIERTFDEYPVTVVVIR